jgi:hypothetical protein
MTALSYLTHSTLETCHLTQSLQNVSINKHTKLCSFDTENMYTNIPTTEVKEVIANILNKDPHFDKERKV